MSDGQQKKILVINAGSSSIKFELFEMPSERGVANGLLERIGEPESRLAWRTAAAKDKTIEARPVADHAEGLRWILAALTQGAGAPVADMSEIGAVGHRVVHGGEKFREPAIIDDATLGEIEGLIPLAPLHNPANVTGIRMMRDLLPHVPQVAVFDTAFHQTMPPKAFHYAIPEGFYRDHDARRYGFHGSSHKFVAREASRYLQVAPERLNLITLHLGNGASAAAIEGGKSVDTSMGLTPLEGLIMGTRCGDLDPALHFYLERITGKPFGEIEKILNRESGLKGICGTNDMREIQERVKGGDERAALALDMFCYRVRKYIGGYFAALGSLDAVVFTGGIGENSAVARARSCERLSGLGIVLDERKNEAVAEGIREIQADGSRVRILVIPTDEEREIAQQTVEAVRRG